MLSLTGTSGVSASIGILMARGLGDGRPARANEIMRVGFVLVYGLLGTAAVGLYYFLPIYAKIASHDPQVHEEIENARFWTCLAGFCLGGAVFTREILIKQGRLVIVFVFTLIFAWIVMLPIGFTLAPKYG